MKRNKLLQGILIVTTVLASVSVIGCTKTIVVEPEPEVVIEEPEVIEEPVVEEPIIEEIVEEESIEEEPVEINPMDMSAKYGLDFETPIYTEEEVAEAKERLQENYEYLEIIDDDCENREALKMVKNDYYASRQNMFYQLYNSAKNIDCKSLLNKYSIFAYVYYFDEENGYIYKITDYGTSIIGIGSDNENYISMYIIEPGSDYTYRTKIGEYDSANNMIIAPNAEVVVYSNEHFKTFYDNKFNEITSCNENSIYTIISKDELLKYGYSAIENEYQNDSILIK